MELQDINLTNDFLGPECLLDSPPSFSLCSLSPTNATHAPLSPAFSSSSLLFGAREPESPTGSNVSGGSGGNAVTSNNSSPQVDTLLRDDLMTSIGVVGSKWLCLVCGDFASGFHYSVVSCEACKAFFKRTIQGNIKYSCPVMNKCEVTKRRRKACQACRFQKCLQAGMMREGVRLDRVRGGRQKYRKRVEAGFNSKVSHSHLAGSRNKLISHLLLTEPAPLAINQDDSVSDSLHTLITLCELLNQELLLLIGWAKQIPGFSALSLVDQMALLHCGWMEALLVTMAWRSQGAHGEELVFARNLRLEAHQCRAAGLTELHEALCHLTCRYQALNLSAEEAVTLRAMALANSDAEPLECPDEVEELQDSLHDALHQYELSRNEQQRTGRLLMSLPLLRQTAELAVQTLLRLCRQHRIPLHKLLLEMLDTKP